MRSPVFGSCFRESDRHGRGNWPLGRHSTSTAVLFFYSDSSATGKGYELKIE